MATVVEQVFSETARGYLAQRRQVVARLLALPRGSLAVRRIGGRDYLYLRRYRTGGRRRELFLGPRGPEREARLAGQAEERKALARELAAIQASLRKLWVPRVERERMEFLPLFKHLVAAFEREGVWELGIELVGSWCFHVYQNLFDLGGLPLRTLDMDFAVSLPLKGDRKDLSVLLRDLGFREEFDYASGKSLFRLAGMSLEFIMPRRGQGKAQLARVREGLGIQPEALPYVDLLTEHPEEHQVRGLGRVVVPAIEAFALHKLLVAGARRDPAKAAKDARQAADALDFIFRDAGRSARLVAIQRGLSPAWRKKLNRAAAGLESLAGHPNSPALWDRWRQLMTASEPSPGA